MKLLRIAATELPATKDRMHRENISVKIYN